MSKVLVNNSKNCYICNVSLGPCRNRLSATTGFTLTPLYEILESFTGVTITKKMKSESSICQECFITIEKYDELQYQSEEIQNKLTSLFSKTHSEQVYIKEESTSVQNLPQLSDVKIKCQKCDESFTSIRELADHSHEESPRRSYAKSAIDSSKISKNFIEEANRQGVDYDYETFQRTFFSENEKESLTKPRKARGEASHVKPPVDPNEKISEKFKRIAQKHGINYNIETFQKAFGFSESESTTKSAERRSKQNFPSETDQEAPKPRKKITINKNFVKSMEENGIKYDLAAFQKAFGYSDSVEAELREDPEVTRECKQLKAKGFVNCAHCDLKFTNRNNFLQHMKVHKPKDRSLFCAECKKYFKTEPCLQIHLATDHGRNNGPVDCPICFKTYTDRSALRSHYYIHKMERSFLCGRCGATFVHKKSFDMHNLMHDDIRPYACTVEGCTKRFRNTGKLKIHLRVHSGEKIYECPHCPGKRFAQKWGMDLHIKKQHKNEIIPNEICKICGISIQTKAKMRLHLANVHQVADAVDAGVGNQSQQYMEESD